MKETISTAAERARKRSLPDLLLHKFLTEYGYGNGPVIAQAIVSDILRIVEDCYQDHLPPKHAIWLAVRRDCMPQRKNLDIRDLVPVRLALVTDSELTLLNDAKLKKQRAAYSTFQQQRLVRWCREA